jgi:hypothetical protein
MQKGFLPQFFTYVPKYVPPPPWATCKWILDYPDERDNLFEMAYLS